MIILEKTNWVKVECRETIIFQPKKELTKGEKYFCKIGKLNMPVVISKDGIEVHMSEPDFREAFGEFERKKEIGRG
jgi:hypothetical protein